MLPVFIINAQSKPSLTKSNKLRIAELHVVSNCFYQVIDSVIQTMDNSVRIKGKYLVAEIKTDSAKSNLIYIFSEGDYLKCGSFAIKGFINYKSKVIFIRGNNLNRTFFNSKNQYRTFDFSQGLGITYDKKGLPIFNHWIFYDLWASWVFRCKGKSVNYLAFCTNCEEDLWMCFDRSI